MPFPELKLIVDETLDDSDKVLFTVPDGEVYEVLWIYCNLTTTAVVGARRLMMRIVSPTGVVVAEFRSKQTQTASLSGYLDVFMPGGVASADAKGCENQPLPQPTLIPAGYSVRVMDLSAIDPTHDDLLLRCMVRRHQVGVQ